ncbi:hypothetical protein D3C81_2167180 [compost metagenome]
MAAEFEVDPVADCSVLVIEPNFVRRPIHGGFFVDGVFPVFLREVSGGESIATAR